MSERRASVDWRTLTLHAYGHRLGNDTTPAHAIQQVAKVLAGRAVVAFEPTPGALRFWGVLRSFGFNGRVVVTEREGTLTVRASCSLVRVVVIASVPLVFALIARTRADVKDVLPTFIVAFELVAAGLLVSSYLALRVVVQAALRPQPTRAP